MNNLSYKNIALPLRDEPISIIPLNQPKIINKRPPILSILSHILSVVIAHSIFSPLLILTALFCISCGTSDTDRVGDQDAGPTYYSGDADNGSDSVNNTNSDNGIYGDGGYEADSGLIGTDGGTGSSVDGAGTEGGNLLPIAFPIGFEPADGEDCPSPKGAGISAEGTAVNAVPAPYDDNTPNPEGGNCFLKIVEISPDGVITIEFTNPQDISTGNYLTFDVSHKDERMLNSAIMFLLLLMDEDDNFASVANTLNMNPNIWYRVSLALDQFIDSDLGVGNGTLNPNNIKRFKIKPVNSSVGMGPNDLISELDLDNISITNNDQTGPIVTE